MTYQKTLDFLYSKLPMFHRLGTVAMKKDLSNTVVLCEHLDNPQFKFKSIHVGGTNGKGSTSHMLAAIFQKAGYKTGLYTSPHLKDFRERIRINGKMISKTQVTGFVKRQKEIIQKIEPSFFEVTVALAFDYFAKEKVDIAIVEVGLGGRLDSTNVIRPEISVITNISLDHTNILGNTLEEIAQEKAGIIKQNTPVVIGEYQSPTAAVFVNKAALENAPITFASETLFVNDLKNKRGRLSLNVADETGITLKNLLLDLTGSYQEKNVLTVIETIRQARKKGFDIAEEAIFAALRQVKGLTGLKGRWQVLGRKPLIICDTGHNEAGMLEVVKNIDRTPHRYLHIVLGMVSDKDIRSVLALLPKNATYYFCAPYLPRALAPVELRAKAKVLGLNGNAYPSVAVALKTAKEKSSANDLIFVGGSTFVVAEII